MVDVGFPAAEQNGSIRSPIECDLATLDAARNWRRRGPGDRRADAIKATPCFHLAFEAIVRVLVLEAGKCSDACRLTGTELCDAHATAQYRCAGHSKPNILSHCEIENSVGLMLVRFALNIHLIERKAIFLPGTGIGGKTFSTRPVDRNGRSGHWRKISSLLLWARMKPGRSNRNWQRATSAQEAGKEENLAARTRRAEHNAAVHRRADYIDRQARSRRAGDPHLRHGQRAETK